MKRCPHCMKNSIGPVCPHCGKSTNAVNRAHHLPIGTVLNGRYEIGASLGQGGFGITYAAWDKQTQQRVAIKEYFPNRCTSQARSNGVNVVPLNGYEQVYSRGMQTFAKEGQTLAQIAHIPEVVHITDGFQANNSSYIVMEFIEGKGLDKVIEEKGRMSVEEVTALFTPLIKVIDQLHQMNITHRDISPDNIILMPDGRLKLIDFGSARHMENGKSVTIHMKAGFTPVEQYTTRGQGPFTDVYSLAATIYYCLTAAVPEDSIERMNNQDNDPLKSLRALGADVNDEQETVILWGMTVQPRERPRSVGVFARRFYEEFSLREQPQPEPVEPTYKPHIDTDKPDEKNADNKSDEVGETVEDPVIEEPKVVIIDDSMNPYDDQNKEKKPNWILIIAAAVICSWLFGALVGGFFLAGMYGIFRKDSKISTKGAKIIVAIALFIVCALASGILSFLVSLL